MYIRYPQDISLLNEAREKLEEIILWFHKTYGVALPRRDCKAARRNYLSFAKSKKHSAKQIRKVLKKQLSYVRRDIGYLENFLSAGYAPKQKDIATILTIFKLYEQQQYMYDNKVHKVENRIVSISQPWIRLIVRGKVKAPACRTLSMLIMSEPDTIPNGFLQTRYIGRGITEPFAKSMA